MLEDYSEFTDETLIKMARGYDNWDAPNALYELLDRGNPLVPQLAQHILSWTLAFDEHSTAQAISYWYWAEEMGAISYIKDHYKQLHIYTLGSILGELWPDSSEENMIEEKKELIRILRDYIVTKPKEDLAEIQHDYNEFMRTYKDF